MKRIVKMLSLFLFLCIIGYEGLKPLPPASELNSLEHPAASPTGSNAKYGWGFVRSKNEEPPFVPQWQQQILRDYNAIYVGPRERKVLAITFDMGYEKEGATPRILEVLAKHNVKGAFFLAGHWVKTQPELLKRLITEGHIVGNHTWNHPSLPDISPDKLTEEIMSWHRHVHQLTGYTAKYLRPPKGEFSRNSLEATKNLGYQSVFWSIAVVDWLPMSNPRQVYEGVVKHLHPGAIILLHGNSMDVVNQLDDIIAGIKERGYSIVSLDELQSASPPQE